MHTTAHGTSNTSEVAILSRVLAGAERELPPELARYVLALDFSAEDKARMHELAVRNQADELSAAEKEELFAYVKAGTLLSTLQSKARRALKARGVNGKAKPH
jgi:hypothetical protein